tara:strand:+ start:1955 stop:2236 length:282 start_codon:yes stop_codon:yes gene_type:complete
MKKFSKIIPEVDTKIISIDYINLNGFDSRHEVWSWDGIMGGSLIFCKKDFKNPESEVLSILENYIKEKFSEKNIQLRLKVILFFLITILKYYK